MIGTKNHTFAHPSLGHGKRKTSKGPIKIT